MTATDKMDKLVFSLIIQAVSVLGAIIFCWPLIWMVGTSAKADRELFTSVPHLLPQRPLAQDKSPFIDARFYRDLKGPRMAELLPVLERHVNSLHNAWPEDVPRSTVVTQLARGIYFRLQSMLPEETWKEPLSDLSAAAFKLVDSKMIEDVFEQIRCSLLLGQLRVRSYDLQEDQLVAPQDAARVWKVEGTAQAFLKSISLDNQPCAELHYNFKSGDQLRLSQTFKTDFPIDRLYRIQLSLRSDESWHPLKVYLEKQGNLYEAVKGDPMADDPNWTVRTWQEMGPDDSTNKIRTWILLKKIDSGPKYENGPHALKVILEFDRVSTLQAWYYKMIRNYLVVFDNMPFWHYAATSVFLVVLNLVGTLFSCSVVAYSFARMRWPGRRMSFTLMLGTMMVPSQVTMIPFFLIIRWLGWYNTLYPLWVCSFFASAFNVFLLYQFFKGIPTELEDAAKIDGCGPLRIYWFIMLPLIKPSLATIAIFTFMGVWNDFMSPLIYINDQRLYPLSLGLYALNVQTGGGMSMMMAGALLMILPVIVIFLCLQRYFVEGITMTGMKS